MKTSKKWYNVGSRRLPMVYTRYNTGSSVQNNGEYYAVGIHFSRDSTSKGSEHDNEFMTVEIPLEEAQTLVESLQKRISELQYYTTHGDFFLGRRKGEK